MHIRRRNERGAEAVEFALVAVPFLILVLGIIQYGFYFYAAETTNSSARETARRIVVGDCWDNTQMTTFAKKSAPMSNTATVSPTPATTMTVGQTVTVTVTSNAKLIGIIPVPDGGVITRAYVARMESTKNSGACPS